MEWTPISLGDLQSRLSRELQECSEPQRHLYVQSQITPSKWQLPPWGNKGGGFWAVAVMGRWVLWFNDVEDGFNVSSFNVSGEIPPTEYWCNQDRLTSAMSQLERVAGRQREPMDLN